jgi:hypothetical protein
VAETPAERRKRRLSENSRLAAGAARKGVIKGSFFELEGWDSPTAEKVPVDLDELRGIKAKGGEDTVTLLAGWDGQEQGPAGSGPVGRQLPYDMGTVVRVTRVVERDPLVKATPKVGRSVAGGGALLGHVIELEFLNRAGTIVRVEKALGKAYRLLVDGEVVHEWSLLDFDDPLYSDAGPET